MTKMRVHELAKELGIENKELLELLKEKHVEVKNHMSSLEDSVADEIRRERGAAKAKKPAAAKGGESAKVEENAKTEEAAQK